MAELHRAQLSWQSVRVHVDGDVEGIDTVFSRLLIVNTVTGRAFDAGLGEIKRCKMLENKSQDPQKTRYAFIDKSVDVMVIRRTFNVDGTVVAHYIPHYAAEHGWVEIVVPNDLENKIFHYWSATNHCQPIQ